MAGDWMKVEIALPDKPEVWQIAEALEIDPDTVVGKLIRVWRWFDQHTVDGNAPIVTKKLIDREVGVSGFTEAMEKAGWLIIKNQQICIPKFDEHNSKSAKNRALTQKRVKRHRNDESNASGVTSPLPEKRRVTVSKDTDGDAVETTEQKIWRHGIDLLTRTGQTEAKARSMLGKCVKEIGPEETLTVIREAWNKADPFTWIAACAVKIKLPNDRDELWRIRNAIGLEYEYDDLKACHAEITQRLRAQPELREVAGL